MKPVLIREMRTLLLAFSLLLQPAFAESFTSRLWGVDGSRWTPESRLPDFSFAGYRSGRAPLPNAPVSRNIKTDYGATGDGVTDDTRAFLDAIADHPGVVFVPEGRYVITKSLRITKSGFVLRGAGEKRTVLYFPKNLMEIEPRHMSVNSRVLKKKAFWYHGQGGHIWVERSFGLKPISPVAADAARGSRTLELPDTSGLRVGQMIEITQRDDAKRSLTNYLYAGEPGDAAGLQLTPWQVATIVGIRGKTIVLDRALRVDLRMQWKPVVSNYQPSVTNVGIEELTIEYPPTAYPGHFFEANNAVFFSCVADSWIRNVTVLNADEGFLIQGRFCTLQGVTVGGSRRGSLKGHNGILFDGKGGDNLARDFTMDAVYMHAISVRDTAGNVFSKATGVDIDFDCAAHGPYANLFTEIDVGKGSRVWKGSGSRTSGKSAAAWNTFWYIVSDEDIAFPPPDYGPQMMNVVGIRSKQAPRTSQSGPWFEPGPSEGLRPVNLHEAQLVRRAGDEAP